MNGRRERDEDVRFSFSRSPTLPLRRAKRPPTHGLTLLCLLAVSTRRELVLLSACVGDSSVYGSSLPPRSVWTIAAIG